MLEEVKGPGALDWSKYLRRTVLQNSDGTFTFEYYAKSDWHKCIFREYAKDICNHSIEFSATVQYITAEGGEDQDLRAKVLMHAMESGAFEEARRFYTYKKFRFKDEFGRFLVDVNVLVKGSSVWTHLIFPGNKTKAIYIGNLAEPKRNLDDIVEQMQSDIQDIYDRLVKDHHKRTDKGIPESAFEEVDLVISHTTTLLSTIDLKDEGHVSSLIIKIIYDEDNHWVYADYAKPNCIPFYREYITKLDQFADNEKKTASAKKIREEYWKEVQYSIATLNYFEIPLPLAIQNGALRGARRKFLVNTTKINEDYKKVMDIEIWVTKFEEEGLGFTKKQVTVNYKLINGQEFTELLGDYGRDRESLDEIVQEFKRSSQETLQEIVNLTGKSLLELMKDGSYFKKRELYHIEQFLIALIEYLKMYNQLNEHFFERKELSPVDVTHVLVYDKDNQDDLIISDKDIPPVSALVGLFCRNAYFKSSQANSKLPGLHETIAAYRRVTTFRHRTIELIKENQIFKVYSLYHNNVLVAVKNDNEFTIFDEELYRKATTPPSPKDELQEIGQIIDDNFITKLIAEEAVPKTWRSQFEKYRGKIFFEAVSKAGPHFGNVERVVELAQNFMSDLAVTKLVPYFLKDETFAYKDPLTNNIFMWLGAKLEFEQIGITKENSRKALDIIKMLEMGQKMFNCTQTKDKKSYERNGDELKTKILEMNPDIKSHEAFSLPLDTSDANKCMNALVPSRKALHGYIATMNLLMLQWSSNFLDTILGVGGNSAAGKTTLTKGHTVVSVDKWKYLLRRGTEILNSQVNTEGANRFNAFLKFIIEETDLKYTLDLRFLEPKFVMDNIIEPARLRGGDCGKMIYLIRPLKTSLLRMLTRSPYGEEAAQETWIVTSGYKAMHANFAAIINLMNSEEALSHYDIYFKLGLADECIARKREGEIEILNPELFEKCKIVPTDEEIKLIEETVITNQMIEEAVLSRDIFEEQAAGLKQFIGQKLGEAVNKNARGGK